MREVEWWIDWERHKNKKCASKYERESMSDKDKIGKWMRSIRKGRKESEKVNMSENVREFR